MQITRALDSGLASSLAQVPGDLKQGTVVSIEVKKVGVERGPADAKVVYNDDFVHVLVWSGFSYKALVARSKAKLEALQAKGKFIQTFHAAATVGHPSITIDDVCAAIQETENYMNLVLAGTRDERDISPPTPSDLPPSVWAPLKLDGKVIPGAKVYVGTGDILNARAPIKGTVYIHGIKLGERVLVPAKNGPWKVNSKPKTIAKDLLASWLPHGLYRSYALAPERLLALRVGKAASDAARFHGIQIDPEAVRSAFKIAP